MDANRAKEEHDHQSVKACNLVFPGTSGAPSMSAQEKRSLDIVLNSPSSDNQSNVLKTVFINYRTYKVTSDSLMILRHQNEVLLKIQENQSKGRRNNCEFL
jgi:hypothetical protein